MSKLARNITIAALAMTISSVAVASGTGTAASADALAILKRISTDFPAILKFLYIVCTAIGIFLVGKATYDAFQITNSNSGAWTGRTPPQVKNVLSGLVIGVIMTAPIFFQVAIGKAFFGGDVLTDSAFVIQTHGMSADQKFVYEAIMNLASLAGTCFFIAGWLKMDGYYKGTEQSWTQGAVQAFGGALLFFLPNIIDLAMKWTGWNFVGTLVV